MSWAGFFSTGDPNADLVKCFACGLELEKWTTEDNPLYYIQSRSRVPAN